MEPVHPPAPNQQLAGAGIRNARPAATSEPSEPIHHPTPNSQPGGEGTRNERPAAPENPVPLPSLPSNQSPAEEGQSEIRLPGRPNMNGQPAPGPCVSVRPASGNSLSADQLVEILGRVKSDIVQDIRKEKEKLEASLDTKMSLLGTAMDKIQFTVIQTSIDARAKDLEGPSKKRKISDPPSVMRHLDLLVNTEQGLKEHLVFLQLLTVLSFAHQHSSFRSWLSAGTMRIMERHRQAVQSCSGFSILHFGCRKDLGTRKCQTRVAAAWSLALRWVLAQKVDLTRKLLRREAQRLGGNPDAHIPPWLEFFGDSAETFRAVENVVSVEEGTDRPFLSAGHLSEESAPSSESDRPPKRCRDSVRDDKRRKMGISGNHDPLLELRVHAVLTMRSAFMYKLTSGRIEARKILFKDVFFLVEQIGKYRSPEDARDNGFDIVFNPSGAPSTLPPSVISPALWKIPLAKLIGPAACALERATAEAFNLSEYKKLGIDFPFLTVTLKWRRTVTNPPADEEQNHYLEEEKELNLHKAIADCLYAAYKLPEFDDLLSSSVLSLRAIHVQAIGLYALLRKLCGYSLCPVEKSALGHVTWKALGTSALDGGTRAPRSSRSLTAWEILESEVTAMYGGGQNVESENVDRENLVAKYRTKILSIPWAAYVKEKQLREMETEHMGEMSTQSNLDVPSGIAIDLECLGTDLAAAAGAE